MVPEIEVMLTDMEMFQLGIRDEASGLTALKKKFLAEGGDITAVKLTVPKFGKPVMRGPMKPCYDHSDMD